jgi:hypothetical protein
MLGDNVNENEEAVKKWGWREEMGMEGRNGQDKVR